MDLLAQQLQGALGSTYEITGLLGRGGMGAVYRATDRRLRREVAIKVLPPALGSAEELKTRFVREARIAASLSHPNIVSIHDVGESGDLVWFVMALVEGETLRARVEREGSLPVGVVRRVLQEVAQALGYAHARGVVHRDIKPDNILLDQATGRAMVTDFGIARAEHAGEDGLTHPGDLVGTARYMAPEQELGEPVDARADQYALGLVAWFMLTGGHALGENTLPAVIARHVRGATLDVATLDRRLSPALTAAIGRCLARRPEDRYERVEQLADALGRLGGALPDTPAPVRTFLRSTEQAFLFTSLLAVGLGTVGLGNVPPVLLAMLATGVAASWTQAIERALRKGVTWPMIRRAVYLERARRVEEVDDMTRRYGLVSGTLVVGTILALILLGIDKRGARLFPETGPFDALLMISGIWGTIVAAKVFGLRPKAVTSVADWKFPRWLDAAGSWLFARFVRRGWRVTLERDRPGESSLTLRRAAFDRPLKRIRSAVERGPSRSPSMADAMALAEGLAVEGKTELARLESLAGRLARLNDGVLASRTVGLAGSLEGEVDRVEAEVDQLRSRAGECARLLEAMALGLDQADRSGLTAALDRAKALSSQVRRLTEIT